MWVAEEGTYGRKEVLRPAAAGIGQRRAGSRLNLPSGPTYSRPDPAGAWLIPGGGNAGHVGSGVVPAVGPFLDDWISAGPGFSLPKVAVPTRNESSVLDFVITRGAPLQNQTVVPIQRRPPVGVTPPFTPPVGGGTAPGASAVPDLNQAPLRRTPVTVHSTIIDLATIYANYRGGPSQPRTIIQPQPVVGPSLGGMNPFYSGPDGGGMAGCTPPRYYIFDSKDGSYNPRRRRRRRQLVTNSDIAGLAKLKGVFGTLTNAGATTWIAMHSR